jgi:hypothetical protein
VLSGIRKERGERVAMIEGPDRLAIQLVEMDLRMRETVRSTSRSMPFLP